MNRSNRYFRYCTHLSFFCLRDPFLFCGSELIQDYLLLGTIFKTHQIPLLTKKSQHQLIKLFRWYPDSSFPYLLLKLALFSLNNLPYRDLISTPTLVPPLCMGEGGGEIKKMNKHQFLSWYIVFVFCCWCIIRGVVLSTRLVFEFLIKEKKLKENRTT